LLFHFIIFFVLLFYHLLHIRGNFLLLIDIL